MGPQHAYALAARLEQVADTRSPQPGHAVSRARPPRTERLDQGHLAENREQPRREVLRHHQARRARAGAAGGTLAAPRRPRRQAADGVVVPPAGTRPAMRRFLLRLLTFFRTGHAEAELAREIEAHLQLLEEGFIAKGMSADAGALRRAARVRRRRAGEGTPARRAVVRIDRRLVARRQAGSAHRRQIPGPVDRRRPRDGRRNRHRRGRLHDALRPPAAGAAARRRGARRRHRESRRGGEHHRAALAPRFRGLARTS